LERVLVLPALQAQQEHLPRRLPRQEGGAEARVQWGEEVHARPTRTQDVILDVWVRKGEGVRM
jgi:hypothetical protein